MIIGCFIPNYLKRVGFGENKIAHIMATEKEQWGIITKNKAIADFHRKIFELLWNQVRRVNK